MDWWRRSNGLGSGGARRRPWPLLAAATALWLAACGDNPGLPEDTGLAVRYPMALAAVPSGELLFVVGANFDRAFRAGKVRVLDTARDQYVAGSLEIPGYAGGVALQYPHDVTPSAALPERMLVTSRDDDGISWASFDTKNASLSCGTHDAFGRCDSGHRFGFPDDTTPIGNDPMGIEVVPWDPGYWRVTVVSSASAKVTVLRMDSKGHFDVVDQISLSTGLYGVKTAPGTGRTYISTIGAPYLHVLRLDVDPTRKTGYKVVAEPTLVLPSLTASSYGRGLALSSDGARLYVADRSPQAVLEIDVTPGPSGAPRNAIAAVMTIGPGPSEIAVAPTGPNGRDLLYVSCFSDDSVWVVDPYLRQTVDVIRLPHGPYALAAVHVAAPGEAKQWKLYAALFGAHKLAVVPIDPASPARNTVQNLLTGNP